ncbi:hypothetical protein PspLS_00144 [Pyricularia sp. CBS 133598]|nr:hypothetical protein PspLS_00144 [Pyricularia sp. CBS 133598]
MWERLSPTERGLVDRVPGLIEMLAITQCDDGAAFPGGMKPEGSCHGRNDELEKENSAGQHGLGGV